MIEWLNIYKVVEAMVPLYVALGLGFVSVKWWHMFTADQCDAINRFNCFFVLPFFTFGFTAYINPFNMNWRFIVADVISKVITILVLAFWANCSRGPKDAYSWFVTSFSLSTVGNTLVVGVPLVRAMYGKSGVDLVIQSSIMQSILWLMFVLTMLEFRRTKNAFHDASNDVESGSEVEESNNVPMKPSFGLLIKTVLLKLAKNPNCYACIIGLTWAFFSNRWHFHFPGILEGSIMIMSKAGSGTSMFTMGLFTALQEKIIACGGKLTVFGLVMRFVAGPAAMAIGSLAMGLHDDVLRVAIIQAALPQAITSFIYHKEYELHANVLSTAVIFGTMVSLPLLIAYYALLEMLH